MKSGPSPVAIGDYDDYHVWHDRYWWVSNQHRPDWIEHETGEEYEAYEHNH